MAEKKKTTKKKAPSVVYATGSARIAHGDGSLLVNKGQAYASDHPAVKASPGLFTDKIDSAENEPYLRRAVERATAAPGERR